MSRAAQFKQALPELFPGRKWQTCLSPPQQCEEFAIVEALVNGERRAAIAPEIAPGNPTFTVLNPENKTIYLFALDNCFFTAADPKRCDCLVYDDDCFCFVELKLGVTSRRQRSERLRNARNQLGATITFFREQVAGEMPGLRGAKLEAYIAMRETLYPRFSASRQQTLVAFQERYGVPLYEKSSKTF